MAKWLVRARRSDSLSQQVSVPDGVDPEMAIARALQLPDCWEPSAIEGARAQWELSATELISLGRIKAPWMPSVEDVQTVADDITITKITTHETLVGGEQHTTSWVPSDEEVAKIRADWSSATSLHHVADQPRLDLVSIPDEGFGIGISRSAPIGVKMLVIVDERQYVVSKNIDHVTVTRLGE